MQYQKVVVQDLDELASAEEVLKAIAVVTEENAEEARVVSTMAVRRRQKWMVVSLPATKAVHVQMTGKFSWVCELPDKVMEIMWDRQVSKVSDNRTWSS